MKTPETAVDAEELLAHADWVRNLARTLVRDPERAADVEQESWLEALRHPPRNASNLRAWLARIVRSRALRSSRSEARRSTRERAAAVPEALPAVDDVVAQAERQRALAGRVLAMEEPFRTVLLLRYFQALPPREIARRLERPLNTVRSQLQRGLERLRQDLDGAHGDRASWCALLLPLTTSEGGPLVPNAVPWPQWPQWPQWIGSLLMGTTTKIALASVALLAVVAYGLRDSGEGPSPETHVAAEAAAVLDPPPRPTAPAAEALDTRREEIPSQPQGLEVVDAQGVALQGRTVDLLARPLGGVSLIWKNDEGEAPPIEVVSQRDGAFRLELPRRDLKIEVSDEDRVAVATGWIEDELWVVVSPAQPMRGRVTDEAGAPVPDARISVIVNAMSLREFERTPDWEDPFRWLITHSDAEGNFVLPRAPLVSDRWEADTFVAKEGFETGHPPLPRTSDEFVEVVLERLREDRPRQVTGIVRAPRGAPVPGAEVFYGRQTTRSNDEGRFELPIDQIYDPMALRAVHADHTPAELDGLGPLLLDSEADIEGIVLVLGPAPMRIEGRVLDETDQPVGGFRVTLQDGTPLGATGDWAELRPSTGPGSSVAVNAEGRFRLVGLSEREYRVRAWNEATGLVLVSEPVRAGTGNLVLRVSPGAYEHLTGFAQDRLGNPIAGIRVGIAYQDVPIVYRGWRDAPMQATTDERGWFDLGQVPRQGSKLVFQGAHVLSSYEDIPLHDEGEPVRVSVPMLTRFRVELEPGDPADSFEILTELSTVQRLSEFHSWGSVVRQRVERTDEGFPVCVCPDDVAMIVLYADDQELRRVPLALASGGVHIVRP